ncbi:MAG: hypothetical protein H6673_03345 [Anaerolineales bacterium]|nr:hypothetical protein [Anaerolineales bacterium]
MRRLGILLCLLALLTVGLPRTTAQQSTGVILQLAGTGFETAVGLGGVSGSAHVISDDGYIHITLNPNGATLPANTVLEGWLVDGGIQGGPGVTNASNADEGFGVSMGSDTFKGLLEAAPYALSTGVLAPTTSGTWELVFHAPNTNFSPYDAVVITAESDGNVATGYDPRPGTPVFAGEIANGTPADSTMLMDEADVMDMGGGVQLSLANVSTDSVLAGLTGSATLYSDSAYFDLTLSGAVLPANTVLEAWLVDAGLETNGPGTSNVSDADEVYGVPFGNADFDSIVERNFYILSAGVAAPQADGTYRLTTHFPNTNFSPYDAVLITAETDGNAAGYDPRPGSPVLLAVVTDGVVMAPSGETATDLPAWQTMELRNASTGEVFTIADLTNSGQTVYVEPMATWCSNCRTQQQILRNVFNELDSSRYVFISLSVETTLSDEQLASYAIREGFPWVFVVANDGLLSQLVDEFGRSITNPPSTPHFVVRPDGSFTSLNTGIEREPALTTLVTGE